MPTEGTSSHHALQKYLQAEFTSTELLQDQRIRHIGKLLAKIDDLNAAIDRHREYGDIGYPTILPSCRTIQSPSPSLLDDNLVNEMNKILHECGEKLTKVLLEAQVKERGRLQKEVLEAVGQLNPNEEQTAALLLQRKRRRRLDGNIKDLPPIKEALPFLRAPDLSKGERFIGANREIAGIFSTGTRQPRGGGETGPGYARQQRKQTESGSGNQGGSIHHSRDEHQHGQSSSDQENDNNNNGQPKRLRFRNQQRNFGSRGLNTSNHNNRHYRQGAGCNGRRY